MRLLLIRHGQTDSNALSLLDTAAPGPALTPLGRAQAAAVPSALRGRVIGSVTASDRLRTQQTALPLVRELGVELSIDPGVGEIPAGELEMRGDAEAWAIYTAAVWAWSRGELGPRIPGSEDGHEFFDRYDSAVERAMTRDPGFAVIVGHAGSIRVWVGRRAQGADPSFAAGFPLHNTGWAMLDRDGEGIWSLLEWHEGPMGGPSLAGASGP